MGSAIHRAIHIRQPTEPPVAAPTQTGNIWQLPKIRPAQPPNIPHTIGAGSCVFITIYKQLVFRHYLRFLREALREALRDLRETLRALRLLRRRPAVAPLVPEATPPEPGGGSTHFVVPFGIGNHGILYLLRILIILRPVADTPTILLVSGRALITQIQGHNLRRPFAHELRLRRRMPGQGVLLFLIKAHSCKSLRVITAPIEL